MPVMCHAYVPYTLNAVMQHATNPSYAPQLVV